MKYNYKLLEEALWAGAIAAGLLILQTLVLFDPSAIHDWRQWAITLAGGSVRAIAGAIVSKLTTPK